jgi:hypothetical protein
MQEVSKGGTSDTSGSSGPVVSQPKKGRIMDNPMPPGSEPWKGISLSHMDMVRVNHTPVVQWETFADSFHPTSVDSEMYHEWYAMAREDYNEMLEFIQSCTSPSSIIDKI